MKKRMVQSLLLLATMVSLTILSVVPEMGQEDIIETDVAAQTEESTVKTSIYAGAVKTMQGFQNLDVAPIKKAEVKIAWTTTRVNVRNNPSLNGDVVYIKEFNTQVNYLSYGDNEEWVKLADEYTENEKSLYVNSNYLSETRCEYQEFSVPSNRGFKSYMPYEKKDGTSIFSIKSNQYKVQQYAYTGNYGIRQIGERYCVAIGTAFNADVGTYIDLVLANGTVIPCVIGDIKADIHTESNNIVTASNGCVSEFIVDKKCLPSKVNNNKKTGTGDISDCCDDWDSPVTTIRIYNKNILK